MFPGEELRNLRLRKLATYLIRQVKAGPREVHERFLHCLAPDIRGVANEIRRISENTVNFHVVVRQLKEETEEIYL